MKARDMGRFLADFLEGFTEGGNVARESKEGEQAPIVIPVDQIREAVASFLQPLIEAETPAEPAAPTPQQLDMMFADAGRAGERDEIAEATLRRVHEVQEAEAKRQRAERNGSAVPETYDPNDPASTKPWTAPILREQ